MPEDDTFDLPPLIDDMDMYYLDNLDKLEVLLRYIEKYHYYYFEKFTKYFKSNK